MRTVPTPWLAINNYRNSLVIRDISRSPVYLPTQLIKNPAQVYFFVEG